MLIVLLMRQMSRRFAGFGGATPRRLRQIFPDVRDAVDPVDVYRDLPIVAGRPAVRLNMIASVDGSTTAPDGLSGGLGGSSSSSSTSGGANDSGLGGIALPLMLVLASQAGQASGK